MMYDNGYGVEQDNKKARKYYMLSVEKARLCGCTVTTWAFSTNLEMASSKTI
jgi:TPR repeat protein